MKNLALLYPEPESQMARPQALGERVEDTYEITIAYVPAAGKIWINSVAAPSSLDEGKTPVITVNCGKEATGVGTGVFFRIYDKDTAEKVCETGLIYPAAGDFSHTIGSGAWTKTMPARAWNLRIEALLWWL